MPGLLLEKPFPGATTCVLVGDALADVQPRLKSFRRLLWLTDPESIRRARPLLPTTVVETLLVGDAPAEPVVEQFLRYDPRHLPSVFVSDNVLTRSAPAYRQAIAGIHSILDSHHRSRVTRQKDGFIWQKHLLANLGDYANRRVPASWAGALRGVPAFICGAGPSLDVSAPHLAAHASKGVVFAADSALRALARHGVRADFAVSVDAAKLPEKCLPADTAPARIVLSAVSPPAWQTALPAAPRTYLSSSQITLDWLAIQGIARTPVAVTENCGATGLELARFLGCAPIYLFGLDLAVDAAAPHKRHHAGVDATVYLNSGYDPSQDLPQVPGNYAAEVPTFAYGDWQALDARLASWPTGLVHNVTDRGARFRNTTLVAPDQFDLLQSSVATRAGLRSLPDPAQPDSAVLNAAFHRVHLAGRLGVTQSAQLTRLLAHRGPEPLAIELRRLFTDQAFARVLGAFSLKLMPHLVPPIEPDTALWSDLLRELGELSHLAANIKS
jgi:hypothetical protein